MKFVDDDDDDDDLVAVLLSLKLCSYTLAFFPIRDC